MGQLTTIDGGAQSSGEHGVAQRKRGGELDCPLVRLCGGSNRPATRSVGRNQSERLGQRITRPTCRAHQVPHPRSRLMGLGETRRQGPVRRPAAGRGEEVVGRMAHPRVGESQPGADDGDYSGFLDGFEDLEPGLAQPAESRADRPEFAPVGGGSHHQSATGRLTESPHSRLQFLGQLATQPRQVWHGGGTGPLGV